MTGARIQALRAVVLALAAGLACQYFVDLVLVNNASRPVEIVWREHGAPDGPCAPRAVAPLAADWRNLLHAPGGPVTSVERVDVGGRPGCRAVVPSFSVLLLASGTSSSYTSRLPYEHLAVTAGGERLLWADSAEDVQALGGFLGDREYGFAIGPPVPGRSCGPLLGGCVLALAIVFLPVVVGVLGDRARARREEPG